MADTMQTEANARASSSRRTPIVACENVSKRFGEVTAVDNVSLELEEGEFFALLGPSGCGKTTLLRMLAGFETPSAGRILIDGKDVAHLPPHKRPLNMMFQSYAVFPHMNVADNIAYGLRMDGVPDAERRQRVADALDLVQLQGFADRMPDRLSGGQRQRVALARALVKRPRVLLLDEPLSALDAKLRDQMRAELVALQEKVGITFIMVTHDQEEALAMASRCAVMSEGRLAQVGSPSELYERPVSRFVADFVGNVNLFEGRLEKTGASETEVSCPELSAPIRLDRSIDAAEGSTVWVGLRPEKIALHKAEPPQNEADQNSATGVVRDIIYLGSVTKYEVELEGGRRVNIAQSNVTQDDLTSFSLGESVRLTWGRRAPIVLLT